MYIYFRRINYRLNQSLFKLWAWYDMEWNLWIICQTFAWYMQKFPLMQHTIKWLWYQWMEQHYNSTVQEVKKLSQTLINMRKQDAIWWHPLEMYSIIYGIIHTNIWHIIMERCSEQWRHKDWRQYFAWHCIFKELHL